MQFSNNFPDQLRAQIPTSDVVGKRVALKQKGKEYSGLCPFHNEKSPSFTVNNQKGFFHCFGCGVHGDIIGFMMKIDGLGFKESVLKLASDYGIYVPIIENEKQEQEQEDQAARELFLLETACQFFENNLFANNGSQALQYLYKRGLNNSQIKNFRLGFAPDGYESLRNHLDRSGFSQLELLSSGIISKGNNGIYDKFRNRTIFPIADSQGQVIAFGGRNMGDEQPKYLNSSETNLFKKGQNLYNFANARKAIYKNKSVIMVEGYMDVISLAINGIENVVAPLGTAITISQLQLLFRAAEDVIICFDGDKAGIAAMQRAIDLVLPIINSKNLVRFALLPKGLDPDDFVRQNGKIAMQNLLENATNLSQALFDFEAKNLHINQTEGRILPETKSQLEAKLYQKISLIADINSKKHFIQFYRNLLFELGRGKNLAKNFSGNSQKNTSKNSILITNDFDKQDKYSLSIINLLAKHPDLKDYQDEFCVLRNLEFKNQNLTNVKDGLIEFFDKNSNRNLDEIKIELKKFVDDAEHDILPYLFSALGQNLSIKNSAAKDLKTATQTLQILLLQYFYEEVSGQYEQILVRADAIEMDENSIKEGKQKDLFEYKTKLEKKIKQLISDLI